MKTLNFHFSGYTTNLSCRRKICTVRLGDKSAKYDEGEIVFITMGKACASKKRIFTAYIDRILVKQINQLSVEIIMSDQVTIICFSEVVE